MGKRDEKNEVGRGRDPKAAEANSGTREDRPKFEPPEVITYSGDEILEELGPAHAGSPGSVVAC